jgi:hypothetical protein
MRERRGVRAWTPAWWVAGLILAGSAVGLLGAENAHGQSTAETRRFDLGQPLATGSLTAAEMRQRFGQ